MCLGQPSLRREPELMPWNRLGLSPGKCPDGDLEPEHRLCAETVKDVQGTAQSISCQGHSWCRDIIDSSLPSIRPSPDEAFSFTFAKNHAQTR